MQPPLILLAAAVEALFTRVGLLHFDKRLCLVELLLTPPEREGFQLGNRTGDEFKQNAPNSSGTRAEYRGVFRVYFRVVD